MNKLYTCSTVFSLLMLLPVSASIPNGSDVLATVKGEPVFTACQLQEKVAELAKRCNNASPEVKAFMQTTNKADFAQRVLQVKMATKIAQHYVEKNHIAPSSFSRITTNAAEIIAQKHFGMTLQSDEKKDLHNCILVLMKLAEQLHLNPAIAEVVEKIPAQVVEKAYTDMLAQASTYNFKETPTYKEVRPFLQLCIAGSVIPEVAQHIQLHWMIFTFAVAKEYCMKENYSAIDKFMRDHCRGKVL